MTSLIQNETELERMINLLALSADLMRKLAQVQQVDDKETISHLADDIEVVADKLVEVLYPTMPPRQ